jgi:ABC-2 type transport system permease protein
MKNQMQNKTYILLDMFNMFSRCLIVFLLYGYVFKISGGSINGVDYTTTLWSMFIYFCIMTFNIRSIDKVIMDDVKSGNVETFLNRPTNYVILTFYKVLGKGLYSFLVISLIGSIAMVLLVGMPNVNLAIFIPTFIITFILGTILGLILYSVIGLLAFFMQDVRPIHWIVDKFVMVLGGSYLPVGLFPPFMKFLAFVSPFGAINFTSSTVYSTWENEFLIRILLQIVWIVVFGLLLVYVYKKAREKAMINGG